MGDGFTGTMQVLCEIELWVNEIKNEMVPDDDFEMAWDDVSGGEIPLSKVKEARFEEVGFMKDRNMGGETYPRMLGQNRKASSVGEMG